MFEQRLFYTALWMVTAALATALAVWVWRRRPAPGVTPFMLMMAFIAWGSFAGGAMEYSTALASKLFWLKLAYLSILAGPALWFSFVLRYTRRRRLSWGTVLLIALEPVFTLLLLWTNEAHGLMWRSASLQVVRELLKLRLVYGTWFWANALYSYFWLALGVFLLIQARSRAPVLDRKRTTNFLLIGLLLGVGFFAYFVFPALGPIPLVVAVLLAVLVASRNLIGLRLFDLAPVVRGMVLEHMQDGVIVFDPQGYITDLNLAAERILGRKAARVIGRTAAQVLPAASFLVAKALSVGKVRQELVLGEGQARQYFDLLIHSVHDDEGQLAGCVMLLRDTSMQKRATEHLARINECLLSFGVDAVQNIQRIVALCGQILGADCALYNRLEGDLLCSVGQWKTPPDYNPRDKPEGHLCYDVIQRGGEEVLVVRNLQQSPYAQSDPNVRQYGLQTYIGCAVQLGAQAIGSLCAVYSKDVLPTVEDKRVISLLAAAIGVEESRRRTNEELQRRHAELVSLYDTALELAATADLQQLLQLIVKRAADLLDGNSGGLYLYRPEHDDLQLAVCQEMEKEFVGTVLKRGEGLSGKVLQSGQPMAVEDYATWAGRAPVYEGMPFGATLAMPIQWGEQALGVLYVGREAGRTFSEQEMHLLGLFAAQAAVVIENARLHAETQRRLQEVEMLYRSSMTINSALELDDRLQLIMDAVVEAVPAAQKGSIHLWDEQRQELVIRASHGYGREVVEAAHFKPGQGYSGWVFVHRQPMVIKDVQASPYAMPLPVAEYEQVKSAICVPLLVGEEAIGTISLDNITTQGAFGERDLRLLLAFAAQAAVAIENARLYDAMQRELSERKRVEAALRQSEARYRTIIEEQTDLVSRFLPDGTLTFVNDAACRYLGVKREDLLGRNFLGSVPEEEREKIRQALARVSPENPMVTIENRVISARGEARWYQWTDRAIFDEEDNLVEFQSVGRDVTEVRWAAQALRESEARYRTLVENLPVGIYRVTPGARGKVLMANSACLRMFGYESMEQLDRVMVSDLYMEPARRKVVSDRILAQGQVSGLELLLKKKDGTPLWGLITARVVYDESSGKPAYFDCTIQDITERKQAEQALRESEEKYRTLFESVPVGLYRTMPDGQLLDANAALVQMLGYPDRESLLGVNVNDHYVNRGDRQRSLTLLEREGLVLGYEMQLRRCSGEVIWVQDSSHAVSGEDGKVLYYEGSLLDITARKRAEEELRQHARELQARSEELDAFAHTVAHDLRAPLTVVITYAQVLEQYVSSLLDEQQRGYLKTMTRNAFKMSNIIDELLLLTGVHKLDVERQPLDMATIVNEALQRLQTLIQDYQAEITLPDVWPTALGHAPWVEEVWANYLSNAIRFGGRPPRVELGATVQEDGMVRFWVRDNGAGIAAEDQARLFTPFTRLAQVQIKGHGLGLSIVHRIIEKLGGQVGVESEVGKGSTFYFTLPLAPPTAG